MFERTVTIPVKVAAEGSQNTKCVIAGVILLAVTWIPLLGIHAYKSSLSDPAAGTIVAVFSPVLSTQELFQVVSNSGGSLVRPLLRSGNMWLVHSSAPGFAGRLKQGGAWGVFSKELFRVEALFSCFARLGPA